jgi:cell wall assembly regulator SMI1
MQQYWNQIERLFQERSPKGYHRYFVPGASEKAIEGLERHVGLQLPEDFKAFYRIHDGQGKRAYGLVFGLELLSIGRIKQEWDNWNGLGDELNAELAHAMSSEPKGFVQPLYLNPRWIPFTTDQTGTHLGMDFDSDRKGVAGQVIAFGRNENKKKVLARSFRDYVHLFVEQLRTIDWSLDEGGVGNQRQKVREAALSRLVERPTARPLRRWQVRMTRVTRRENLCDVIQRRTIRCCRPATRMRVLRASTSLPREPVAERGR